DDHLDLAVSAVLRLVDDDEGVVQRAAAQVADGRDLYLSRVDQVLQPLEAEPVVQRVVKRTQVGRHLVLQVAGQEADPLPRLHRRARQDDAVDLAFLEGLDRGGNGQVRLARTRGADGE